MTHVRMNGENYCDCLGRKRHSLKVKANKNVRVILLVVVGRKMENDYPCEVRVQ